LVTREEMHQQLWPRAVVDFDHGLNKAINKIRDVLGDSAASPRFVETVARRGYRFLADVTVIEPAPAAAPSPVVDEPTSTNTLTGAFPIPSTTPTPPATTPPVETTPARGSPRWKRNTAALLSVRSSTLFTQGTRVSTSPISCACRASG